VISFDTNILVYAANESIDERHPQAVELVERAIRSRRCIQTLQSLAEFYNATTRRASIAPIRAAALVAGWQRVIPVATAGYVDLEQAMRAVGQHRLAFWDALLWATARRAGVQVLVSEDFQDGRDIEGVRIANPFIPANHAVIEAALQS
jgi:predicted nucleic acid-binding protein